MTSPAAELRYDLLVPRKIVFGWGRRAEVGELAATLGRRALIVLGSRTLERGGVVDELTTRVEAAGIDSVLIGRVTREPEVADVDRLVERAMSTGIGAGISSSVWGVERRSMPRRR